MGKRTLRQRHARRGYHLYVVEVKSRDPKAAYRGVIPIAREAKSAKTARRATEREMGREGKGMWRILRVRRRKSQTW